MKIFRYRVAGEECLIYYPENSRDIESFFDFLDHVQGVLAVDTETTGLDTFSPDFKVRLVQFGDRHEAWVLNPDLFRNLIIQVLHTYRGPICMFNQTFDILVLDATLGVDPDVLFPRVTDVYILSHLHDPRNRKEGGTGHGLKDLCAVYVDPGAPDTSKELREIFRHHRFGSVGGWRRISIAHPTYLTYAGLDVILTSRLYDEMERRTRHLGHLIHFEHQVARVCAYIERQGVTVDAAYSGVLVKVLEIRQAEAMEIVNQYGVTSVDSNAEVVFALETMGETLSETTDTGQPKVDRRVLLALADLDLDGNRTRRREPNPLAEAILAARRAGKWLASYAVPFLRAEATDWKLYARINALQARTARMSITEPPMQQLPSGDYSIRRGVVPAEGNVIGGCDYSQIEMRVLAAISRDRNMLDVVKSGQDIHDMVSKILFGPGFTPKQRKLAKNTGFGKVYGGGKETLALQAGVPVKVAQEARQLFDQKFPGVAFYSLALQQTAKQNGGYVVSPIGRRLPLDDDRLYAGTNYIIQSTARDLFVQGLINLDKQNLLTHVRLPVHDEVVFEAPRGIAEQVGREIQEAMRVQFSDVELSAEAEIYGPSWGHGYGACDETDREFAEIASRHIPGVRQGSLW